MAGSLCTWSTCRHSAGADRMAQAPLAVPGHRLFCRVVRRAGREHRGTALEAYGAGGSVGDRENRSRARVCERCPTSAWLRLAHGVGHDQATAAGCRPGPGPVRGRHPTDARHICVSSKSFPVISGHLRACTVIRENPAVAGFCRDRRIPPNVSERGLEPPCP